MRRFTVNRWWAFILTLSVLLASSATLSTPSRGDGLTPFVIGGGAGGSENSGDPDGPAGPNKRTPTGGRASPGGNGYAAASVGDGGVAARVGSWRFHVVLRSLISRFFRY